MTVQSWTLKEEGSFIIVRAGLGILVHFYRCIDLLTLIMNKKRVW